MPTIRKHASRGHGSFNPTSVGLYEYGGKWYYHVISSTQDDQGSYEVGLNEQRNATVNCTCKDYVDYRQARSESCKHMLGINQLLELKNERLYYEQVICNLRQQIEELRRKLELLQQVCIHDDDHTRVAP